MEEGFCFESLTESDDDRCGEDQILDDENKEATW